MPTKNEQAISKYKYTTQTEWDLDVCGTHKQGTIRATRAMLEASFGKPHVYDPDDWMSDGKTTTEWIVKFDDGVVATIYDWKRYEQGAPAQDEFVTWHIGAHENTDAVDRINYLTPPF